MTQLPQGERIKMKEPYRVIKGNIVSRKRGEFVPDDEEKLFLEQGLRELLYAFRKNGGDIEYCVKQIFSDFNKAGYKSPEEVAKAVEASNTKMMVSPFGRHFTSFEEMAEANSYVKLDEDQTLPLFLNLSPDNERMFRQDWRKIQE